MRKFIFSLTALSLGIIAKAQFNVALVGGPQINSVTPNFSVLQDTSSLYTVTKHTGLNFGFIGNVSLNKKQTLFLRTGALYSARGVQTFQNFDTSNLDLVNETHYLDGTTILKVNYIDLPLGFELKLPIKGKTKFLLGAGVQGSLFYNGSTDFSGITLYKIDKDSAAKQKFKQTTVEDLPVGQSANKYGVLYFSGSALTGFEFGRVFLTANYSYGLSPFYKDNAQSYKHNTLAFHLGIFLGNPQKPDVIKDTDKDRDGINDDVDLCPDLPGSVLTKGCPDKDGDGIPDREDRCPDVAGTLQYNGCPIPDKDGDGVSDDVDRCPDIAGEKKYSGCPIPDTDKDGVNDEEDRCPDVAGSKKYNGCPVPDTDNDGINDEEDKCPTLAGEKENQGCPKVTAEQQQKISYAAKSIQFEFKKVELTPSSFKVLDEVAEILKTNPTLQIKVEGHSSGPESESNRILSQKRAETVKDYFISKGIAAARISAEGFGSSRHISEDGDKHENAIDRRVELKVL